MSNTHACRPRRAARRGGLLRLRSRPRRAPMPSRPRAPLAFRDSVGVVTHVVYYDTAYGELAAASSPGSTSWACATCATACTATPRRSGATGTSATTGRWSWRPPAACASPSSWAARARRPARIDELARRRRRSPAPRRRGARGAQRVRQVRRRPRAGRRRSAAYGRELYRKVKAQPARCARCRCSARRSPTPDGPSAGRGPARLDGRRQHPPLHGRAVARPEAHRAPSWRAPASSPAPQAGVGDRGGLPQRACAVDGRAAAGVRARRRRVPAAHVPRALPQRHPRAPTPTS